MPGVAVVATVNPLPVKVPSGVIVHDTDAKITGAAGDCKKLHKPASAVLNPKPVAATLVPIDPELGVSVT